jgi:hypothetical protein
MVGDIRGENEIDEIFARSAIGKGKAKEALDIQADAASGSVVHNDKKSKKKKKQKKQDGRGTNTPDAKEESTKKQPVTVVDPSIKILASSAASTSSAKRKKGESATKQLTEEEKEFRDSRGTSSESLSRSTLVYTLTRLLTRTQDRRRFHHLFGS